MPDNPYRLFTAVPLPDEVKSRLSEWAAAHKRDYPFQKWAHKDDLHITLFFMGDTEPHRIPGIQEALRGTVHALSPFRLVLNGLGTFGPPAAPSILWTGLGGDRDLLTALQREVVNTLVRSGFQKEDKPFRPHITLARRYTGSSPWTQHKGKLPTTYDLNDTAWTCDRITLYRSHLGRTPMYEIVEEYRLPLPSVT